MSTELTVPPHVFPTDAPAIAELRNITKSFIVGHGRELKVLDQIDLAIHEGELLALLGQSGSGKSTLLRCLTGLTKPTSGRVLCYGRPLEGINPNASIVFQTFALYPWLTVEQNVEVGLMAKRLTRTEKAQAVEKAIDLIGLNNYHSAFPREIWRDETTRRDSAGAGISAQDTLSRRSIQCAGCTYCGKPSQRGGRTMAGGRYRF